MTLGDGTRARIDEVEVGEKVLATDPATGESSPRRVEQVFAHADVVVDLHLVDGSVVATTEDHPFWSVSDQRFERADELTPGELVRAADGRVLEVAELALDSARRAMAYNLAVEGVHTFHVGEPGVLVHNTCKTGRATGAADAPEVGSGNAYSVAYQMKLSPASYPGVSRRAHFQEANADLLRAMDSDAGFTETMNELIPGIREKLVRPQSVSDKSPNPWTWHHAAEPGVMQLVPRAQHEAPGRLRQLFHLGGLGGYAIWGKK